MARLPEEVKIKWVAALRSGEYKQTTGQLADTDYNDNYSFCCLGVLAEVLEPGITKHGGALEGLCTLRDAHDKFNTDHGLWALFEPNTELHALASDFRSAMPEGNDVSDKQADSSLMTLNDDGKYTFNQIADLIEEHL